MMKSKILSLLLAATLLIPQFAFAASAAEYKTIEYVENGSFDKAPTISNNTNTNYKNLAEGTWWYRTKNTNELTCDYVNGEDGSYLRITSNDNMPTLVYRAGVLEAGDYTLSFEINPQTTTEMNRVKFRLFSLDDAFTSASNGASMGGAQNGAISSQGKFTKTSYDFTLTEDTDLALDFWTANGGNDALITGTLDIDNVSIVRKVEIAEDVPSAMYTFAEALEPGDYTLSLDVFTDDAEAGTLTVADVSEKWDESALTQSVTSTAIDGGFNLTVTFTVAGDSAVNTAFRYSPVIADGETAAPFSIDNVKLEGYGTYETPEVITSDTFDDTAVTVVDTTQAWESVKAETWTLKDKQLVADFEIKDGSLYFNKTAEGTPAVVYGIGNLERGSYKVSFDINMTNGRDTGTQFNYAAHYTNSGRQNISSPTWNFSAAVGRTVACSLSFDVANDENYFHYFRFWPHDNGKALQYEFTIDNLVVAATAGKMTFEEYTFDATPSMYTDAGVNCNDMGSYSGKWCISETLADTLELSHNSGTGRLDAALPAEEPEIPEEPEITGAATLTVVAPEAVKAGETFEAGIYVTASEAKSLAAMNFSLTYGSGLTLVSIEPAVSIGEGVDNGAAYAWTFDYAEGGIAVGSEPVQVATATFKANDLEEDAQFTIGIDTTEGVLLNAVFADEVTMKGFTPAVVGDTVTVEATKVEITFIEADEYMALASDQRIAVIAVNAENTNDTTYTLTYSEGVSEDFYYSERYDSYVAIVDVTATAESLQAILSSTDKPAEKIDYSGDVNGDGRITAGDAALISDLLHSYSINSKAADKPAYTDIVRLRADVLDTADVYVTVADATKTLRISVGLE